MTDTAPPISDSAHNSRAVMRAGGAVATATALSRVLGLVRDAAIAQIFGAGSLTDAFFAAFKIPNLLRRLVAEGAFQAAFIPIFAADLSRSPEAARRTLNSAAAAAVLTGLLLLLPAVFFTEELIALIAPGFASDPAQLELTSSLLLRLLPYLLILGLLAVCSGALNALGIFGWPALAPAVLNLSLILGLFWGRDFFSPPIFVLPAAVVLGAAASLLPLLILLAREGMGLRLRLAPSSSIRSLGRMLLPALLGASGFQLLAFLNGLLASLLERGSVSWLYYADRLFQFPLGIFTMAAATVVLPALARSAAYENRERFSLELTETIAWISYLTIPASCGLYLLAEPIIALIYERGSFDPSHTAPTASALAGYSLGLWAISCQSVFVRAFLARRLSIVPGLGAAATVVFHLLLALMLMGPAVQHSEAILAQLLRAAQEIVGVAALGHYGLALATSLSAWLSALLLAALLWREGYLPLAGRLFPSLLKTSAATAVMAALLTWLAAQSLGPMTLALVGVPLGALTYLLLTLLLRSPETSFLLELVTSRSRRGQSAL